jgi:hypothetical protein
MKITAIRATPLNIPLEAQHLWSHGSLAGFSKATVEVETSDGIMGLGGVPSPANVQIFRLLTPLRLPAQNSATTLRNQTSRPFRIKVDTLRRSRSRRALERHSSRNCSPRDVLQFMVWRGQSKALIRRMIACVSPIAPEIGLKGEEPSAST